METLSVEERIELSKLIGAPVDGVLGKADSFIKQIEPILKETADGPREAVILLAISYLFFSIRYTKDPTDESAIENAKSFLDQVIGLIYLLGDERYE